MIGGSLHDARPEDPLGRVRRIAVFRALVLGDMLCALPALRALRARFPTAHIALVGLPWAREWAQRVDEVDEFIAFPGWPGLPEKPCAVEDLPDFIADMQGRRLDLAVQLHGSGGTVNPMIATWGARRVAAFFEPGAWCPDPELGCPWPREGTEVQRLLCLPHHLGAPAVSHALALPLTDEDRAAAMALLVAQSVSQSVSGRAGQRLPATSAAPLGERYVVVHPGAQLPSRRWPPARFAQVADALAEQGCTVVLTGTAGEAPLAQAVKAAMLHRPLDLVGRTTLWTFGALVEAASLVVCNDTGASHVAAALGTPSVVISSGSDVSRWAPADFQTHRVLWADRECRPCAHATCPYPRSCADDIDAAVVLGVAAQMLKRPRSLS